MKYTLFLTQRCNLACSYCYITKKPGSLSLETAKKAVDYMFANTRENDVVDIGYFGGEPFLELQLMESVTKMIMDHPRYDDHSVILRVVTNGTIFSREIGGFLERNKIGIGVSCDGLPWIQNRNRPFRNGMGSSEAVIRNLQEMLEMFPLMPVNAVFNAASVSLLPQTIDFFSSLGVRNIHLNPDIGSSWSPDDMHALGKAIDEIADKYFEFYLDGSPHYISLIDAKIAVILRGGYRPDEKCSMGRGEQAIGVTGNIYPCERLVGGDDGVTHCMGHIDNPDTTAGCQELQPGIVHNLVCQNCSLRDYCMNWCGCTNFFGTGDYNRVNSFICGLETRTIRAALKVIERTGETNISFLDHLQGTPLTSLIGEVSV